MLCQYKYALGVPGEGFHSYMAIFDWLATIVVAWIFSYLLNIKFIYSFLTLFAIGELLHLIFCVPTRLFQLISSIFCHKKM